MKTHFLKYPRNRSDNSLWSLSVCVTDDKLPCLACPRQIETLSALSVYFIVWYPVCGECVCVTHWRPVDGQPPLPPEMNVENFRDSEQQQLRKELSDQRKREKYKYKSETNDSNSLFTYIYIY